MYSFNTLELILIWINKKHNVSNNSKLLNNIFYIVLQHDHWDKSKLYIFNGGKLQMIKWSINKHRSCFFNNFFVDLFSLFEKQNALLFLNLIKSIPVYKNNLIYILYNLCNTNTFLGFFLICATWKIKDSMYVVEYYQRSWTVILNINALSNNNLSQPWIFNLLTSMINSWSFSLEK